METLEVIAVGTKVKFAESDLRGVVIGIWIRDKRSIQYEIAYWQGERRTAWVQESEVESLGGTYANRSIGFRE